VGEEKKIVHSKLKTYVQEPEIAGSKGWDARHPRTATQVT
jgi:hypothetical protein